MDEQQTKLEAAAQDREQEVLRSRISEALDLRPIEQVIDLFTKYSDISLKDRGVYLNARGTQGRLEAFRRSLATSADEELVESFGRNVSYDGGIVMFSTKGFARAFADDFRRWCCRSLVSGEGLCDMVRRWAAEQGVEGPLSTFLPRLPEATLAAAMARGRLGRVRLEPGHVGDGVTRVASVMGIGTGIMLFPLLAMAKSFAESRDAIALSARTALGAEGYFLAEMASDFRKMGRSSADRVSALAAEAVAQHLLSAESLQH